MRRRLEELKLHLSISHPVYLHTSPVELLIDAERRQ